jgi:hypothetical protein
VEAKEPRIMALPVPLSLTIAIWILVNYFAHFFQFSFIRFVYRLCSNHYSVNINVKNYVFNTFNKRWLQPISYGKSRIGVGRNRSRSAWKRLEY